MNFRPGNFETIYYFETIFVLNYTCTHENMGCKQLQTGLNGRGWVWMGALGRRGHGGHKNKASRGHIWSYRPRFGSYGRRNFPGHHVLEGYEKNGVNGCRWVQVDADGGERTHGQWKKQKQGKRSNNWAKTRHILNACTQRKKPGSAQGWSWWP